MRRVLIAVDLPDGERLPEIGEAFYVSNAHYEQTHVEGLHGHVVEDAALIIHQTLFPERYPQETQDHMFWDDVDMPPTREELSELDNAELYERAYMELPTAQANNLVNLVPEHEDDFTDEDRETLISAVLAEAEKFAPPVFEWPSEIGEWVATILDTHLAGHPGAKP